MSSLIKYRVHEVAKDFNRGTKEIADILAEETGWNVNSTYTVIKKRVAKGAVERRDPGFRCRALIAKEEVQAAETEELVSKLFDGSVDKLFASLLSRDGLSAQRLEELRRLVEEQGGEP